MIEIFITYLIDKIRQCLPGFGNQLDHVTTYVREMPVNLDRMYENAIDGEHLPHLHSTTFAYIEILESGDWGWRAKAGMQPRSRFNEMEIQLTLNREENCWKTVTLSGLGKGTEIWTHAIPTGENQIKVVVDFFVPKLPSFLKPLFAPKYQEVYHQLYNEDLMMMQDRQEALDFLGVKGESKEQKTSPLIDGGKSKLLGKVEDIAKALPMTFDFEKKRYCLTELDGEYIAFAAMCPHMLGPLDKGEIENGVVECPWHGYKFDIKTGEAANKHKCKLKPGPRILVDKINGELRVTF